MPRAVVLAVAAIVVLACSVRDPAHAQAPQHPLDALSEAEIARAVTLMRKEGHVTEMSHFADVRLVEAPKEKVLKWASGSPLDRKALLVTRTGGRTFETVIDLAADKVLSHDEIGGVQTAISRGERERARALTKADERWRTAMRKRGFADFGKIDCSALAAGHFPEDTTERNRILKVVCYDTARPVSGLVSRPIEGVLAIVDTGADAVIEVIDSGAVRPPVEAAGNVARERTTRAPLKPVLNINPQGANYSVRPGWQVNWQNWSFHLRTERRPGPVLSLVRFRRKKSSRLVAYQMALSEIFAPFMHPDETWSFRTPMHAGESGFGYTAYSLRPGRDCPEQATYLAVAVPNDKGGLLEIERGLCIFERNVGDPLWRRGDAGGAALESRPAVELVVRMIAASGSHDYVLDWVFSLSGAIRVRVGVTGGLAIKTINEVRTPKGEAKGDFRFGTLVAPGALAVYHDHFFNFRLDLDVDGQNNTVEREVVAPKAISEGKRRSLWVIESERVLTEGPVRRKSRHEIWRILNTSRWTDYGHRPGYQIAPSYSTPSVLSPDDPPQARAGFSAQTLWVTAFKPRELYAGGSYPNQSKDGSGLPKYVDDKERTEDTDIVIWYTLGFHHVTRVEDWPVMPIKWHEFTLRPFNFFDENPAMDLAPGFRASP